MKKSSSKANQNILWIVYGIVGLFTGMMIYFGYFLQVTSESVINNSYNARLDSFSNRVLRGDIISKDGKVLAETVLDEEGNEVRSYPYGSLFSHVVGYSTRGKTGLESLGDFYLLSSHVNPLQQVTNELSSRKNPGDYIVTTLDTDLQTAAFEALGDRRGAVVVLAPDTGQILAMISKPDFDPNMLNTEWDAITTSGQSQLLNRGTQGLYPPGSTFKIVTALEYIRENPDQYQEYTFDCNGIYKNGNATIRCYHGNAHGHQSLSLAFANSCNGAFSSLGLQLDKNSLKHTSEALLFNQELPISLAYNKSSYVMEEGAAVWQVLQTAIGQGETQITPMHNAIITAAIANGGVLMKPYLIDRIESYDGGEVKKFIPQSYGAVLSAKESMQLTELMELVVTEGTASGMKTEAYTVAGKTGSAEFDKSKESHAWFVGFAPVNNPKVVISVLVEEGGSGGQTAVPIARAVFDKYFSETD